MAARAVFLDRDDTIIRDPGYISEPSAVSLLPGAALAIKSLSQAGFKIVVITNQSGVARGILNEEALEKIHKELGRQLAQGGAKLDAIYYCPFHPDGIIPQYSMESELRKPSPGMLLKAAKEMNIDLASSWMVGDSSRDVEAGRRAGCRTILIARPPKNGESASQDDQVNAEFKVRNLVDAARVIMREAESRSAPAAVANVVEDAPVEEKTKTPVEALAEVVKNHTAAKVDLPSSPKPAEPKVKPSWPEPKTPASVAPAPAAPAVIAPPVESSKLPAATGGNVVPPPEKKATAKPVDKSPAQPPEKVVEKPGDKPQEKRDGDAASKPLFSAGADRKANSSSPQADQASKPIEKIVASDVRKEASAKSPAEAVKEILAPAAEQKVVKKPAEESPTPVGNIRELIDAAQNVLAAKSAVPKDIEPPTPGETISAADVQPSAPALGTPSNAEATAVTPSAKIAETKPAKMSADEPFSIIRAIGGMVQMLVLLPLVMTGVHLFRSDYSAATAWGIAAMILQVMALTIYTMLLRSK